MLRRWHNFSIKLALRRALKKLAPERFPHSSANDLYIPVFTKKGVDDDLLVYQLSDGKITGRRWRENRFQDDEEVELADLSGANVKISRFYGSQKIDYGGVWEFWFGELLFFPQRKWLRDKFGQWVYNTTTQFRHDRNSVLRQLIEFHIEDATKNENFGLLYDKRGETIVSLFQRVYGRRVYGHPAYQVESVKFRLTLDALVASNDLEKVEYGEYKLTDKAPNSIAEYELAERRHKDSVVLNRRLVVLTLVLAIAAVLQAIAAFVEFWT